MSIATTSAPTHPKLLYIEHNEGSFASFARAAKDFKAGEVIVHLEGLTTSPKSYATVQFGPGLDDHIKLNSDFVYVNHSCEPNICFDLNGDRASWHVRALRDIQTDEALTFFYPSTEWEMDQPFKCLCETPTCLQYINGAKTLSLQELNRRGHVSSWIQERLLNKRWANV